MPLTAIANWTLKAVFQTCKGTYPQACPRLPVASTWRGTLLKLDTPMENQLNRP